MRPKAYILARNRLSLPQKRTFATTMTKLMQRAVAGSFIFKFPNDDISQKPQVALFRRSGDVSTYQHKYAPISGSIEESDANPLATAWRELQEETTLDGTSLKLFRQGKPYSFGDESVGREWTINPFGFVLKSVNDGGKGEAGIQIDWEHEGYAWFDPDEVSDSDSFGGVPRLLESLRRVWFNIDLGEEAGNALGAGLITLQQDHESGARQLASKALGIYIDVIRKLDRGSAELWWKNVRFAGWHLWKNGRESMGASILSVVLSSLAIIEEKLPKGELTSSFIEDLGQNLEEYGRQRQQASGRITQLFGQFVEEHFAKDSTVKVLTLSASSTILSCLTHALGQQTHHLDLRILESRPLFEGVKTAESIISFAKTKGIKADVTLYTDASAGLAAKDVDLVIVGADLIDGMGNVSNKTGSLPAVLAAKHLCPHAKIVALAEKEKVLPFEPPGHEEDNSPQEVTDAWGQQRLDSSFQLQDASCPVTVQVKNVYFEWVPATLIDLYVTEDGVTSAEGVSQRAREVRDKADRYFSGL